MEENNKPSAVCDIRNGRLPGLCQSLAFPYVPMQESTDGSYEQNTALECGTLFPGLNLPFVAAMKSRNKSLSGPLAELMALDFAVHELVLYLDTHRNDRQALEMLHYYHKLAMEGRMKYQQKYGPLTTWDIGSKQYNWPDAPWPWEGEGGKS